MRTPSLRNQRNHRSAPRKITQDKIVAQVRATATVAITRLIRAVDDPMLRTVVLGRAWDHLQLAGTGVHGPGVGHVKLGWLGGFNAYGSLLLPYFRVRYRVRAVSRTPITVQIV